MSLKMYNSLTRQKEEFVPLNPDLVTMYVCGPTVYNYIHIGNARAFVFFDVVRRYLRALQFDVKYIQNLTDVDDKILAKAREDGRSIDEVTAEYIEAYFDDTDALGVWRADVHPRATEYVGENDRLGRTSNSCWVCLC